MASPKVVGAKAIGLLAVVAITGVTAAVGVLVSSAREPPHATTPSSAPRAPHRKPALTTSTDVRTTALHRAHLEGAQQIDCAGCHDLRAQDFKVPSAEKCAGCHANHEPAIHAGSPEATACAACHDFLSPGRPASWAPACGSCHAEAQGEHAAIGVHAEQDCVRCHAVHGPPRPPADCLGCHDPQVTAHRASATGAAACMACHTPHTPAKAAAARCAECHVDRADTLAASVRIPSTAIFPGHDRCVQCHADHQFSTASVRSCRDCHQTKHVSTAHAACTSCHDPHAPRVAPPPAKCTSCHQGKPVLASAAVPSHAACTSCHDPHAQAAPPPATKCAGCHREIATSSTHPGGDCVGCHPPHGKRAASQLAVGCTAGCHAEKRAPGVGHGTAACRDCHQQHRFVLAAPSPAFCLGCHARPIDHAPAIVTADGHAGCASCHVSASHRPSAPRPACATCHAVQASTAPSGHVDCARCHDVHSGKRRPEVRCEGCHVDRTRTPHVRVPGGCTTCHQPHGPGPMTRATCTQCHTGLAGLHVVAKHQTCTDCHRAHATEVTDRERCLRCHVDRRDHEPDAKRCQACHPFEAP